MNRLARLALALTITSAIGIQIPTSNGVALAQDGYNPPTGSGKADNAGKILGVDGENIVSFVAAFVLVAEITGKSRPLPPNFDSAFSFGEPPPLKVLNTSDGMSSPSEASASSSNGTTASLLEVSSGTARELIAKCPTLSQQLANEGPFTMFLPSDEALASVKLEGAALETFLKRHIVLGRYSYSDLSGLSNGAKLQTLAETELAVSHNESGEVLVGGEIVPNEARSGSNGFSYAVKNVLP